MVPPTDFLTIERGRGRYMEYGFAGDAKNCSVQMGVPLGIQINTFNP